MGDSDFTNWHGQFVHDFKAVISPWRCMKEYTDVPKIGELSHYDLFTLMMILSHYNQEFWWCSKFPQLLSKLRLYPFVFPTPVSSAPGSWCVSPVFHIPLKVHQVARPAESDQERSGQTVPGPALPSPSDVDWDFFVLPWIATWNIHECPERILKGWNSLNNLSFGCQFWHLCRGT